MFIRCAAGLEFLLQILEPVRRDGFGGLTASSLLDAGWSLVDLLGHDLLALVVEHRLPQELYDLRVRNAPDVGFVEPLSNAVGHDLAEIGRASCRERVCQYV